MNDTNNELDAMKAAWFESDDSVDSVTLAEFDKYITEYLQVREEKDAIEERLTEQNKKLKKMESKLIEFLDAQSKTSHITAKGKINCVERTTWKAPEGEQREFVVEYLKEKGLYDSVTAFNANKFSGWYENERSNNPNFNLQGVEQNTIRYISFRKG